MTSGEKHSLVPIFDIKDLPESEELKAAREWLERRADPDLLDLSEDLDRREDPVCLFPRTLCKLAKPWAKPYC